MSGPASEELLKETNRILRNYKGAGAISSVEVDDLLDHIRTLQAALRSRGQQQASEAVFAELRKAIEKFPTWPTDPLHALAVLGEEYGELTKEVLQLVYEPHKSNKDEVRKEAIQTAAMALRFVASLDRYEYTRGQQHAQEKSA